MFPAFNDRLTGRDEEIRAKGIKKKITWDDIIEMAFGVLRINPAVFWRMSLRDWILTQRGFFNNQERQMQAQWEQTRMISYYSAVGFLKQGTRITDIMHFPWEQKEAETYTDEEIRYILLKYGMNTDGEKFFN